MLPTVTIDRKFLLLNILLYSDKTWKYFFRSLLFFAIFSFLVAGAIHNVFMLAIMLILFGYIGLKLSNKMIHSSEII